MHAAWVLGCILWVITLQGLIRSKDQISENSQRWFQGGLDFATLNENSAHKTPAVSAVLYPSSYMAATALPTSGSGLSRAGAGVSSAAGGALGAPRRAARRSASSLARAASRRCSSASLAAAGSRASRRSALQNPRPGSTKGISLRASRQIECPSAVPCQSAIFWFGFT